MKQLLFICILFFSMQLVAQSNSSKLKSDKSAVEQKKFDKKALDNYKSKKEFNYNEQKKQTEPTFLERALNWLGRKFFRLLEWVFGVKYAQGIFSFILKALPYLILIAVLLLMLKFFLKVNSKNIIETNNNKPIVSITEEEELIRNEDLPKLIQQAIEQKNFRLAVRFYYLMILKKLEGKELIVWEQQKTNEDYIKEISKKSIQNSFSNLTRLYDFVWYGNFDINEVEFSKIESDFQEANRVISK